MAAAAAIRKYGWVQQDAGSMTSGFCVLSAFCYIASPSEEELAWQAIRELRFELSAWPLFAWNDAPGRTKEQVIALLEGRDWRQCDVTSQ